MTGQVQPVNHAKATDLGWSGKGSSCRRRYSSRSRRNDESWCRFALCYVCGTAIQTKLAGEHWGSREWSGNARYKIWDQGNFTTGRWPAQRGLAPVIPPNILDIRQSHLAFRLAARPHRAISRFWNPRVRITANRSLSPWVSNARRQIARCQPCPVIRCESCLHAQPYLMFPLLPNDSALAVHPGFCPRALSSRGQTLHVPWLPRYGSLLSTATSQ